MFEHLQIYDRRERWMVGTADVALTAASALVRAFSRHRAAAGPPRRILLLRLERIGDLLMAWPAIAAVRRVAPGASIDLVVGSWNVPIAQMFEEVDRVRTLDARWLSRGAPAPAWSRLIRDARAWRSHRYDLAINFEGDIRSHLLMACSGAPRRFGFDMAGGGPLLTGRVPYDPSRHVADNLLRLVERALDVRDGSLAATEARLKLPAHAREAAGALLADPADDGGSHRAPRLRIGIQVGGGRQVKQWDPRRFGELGGTLAVKFGAQLVFTGSAEDRQLVDLALGQLPPGIEAIDLCGRVDLLTLAALLERLSVFVTGDTGPMHLAGAVGTPLVAIFGPSDPRRWGPLSSSARIVHSGVNCRPCNRIRRPPSHCIGVTPDCLASIGVHEVVQAVEQVLGRAALPRAASAPGGSMEAIDAGR